MSVALDRALTLLDARVREVQTTMLRRYEADRLALDPDLDVDMLDADLEEMRAVAPAERARILAEALAVVAAALDDLR